MLHEEIAARLRTDIREGEHPVGATLPTERELAARFDASPGTVRLALRALQLEGTLAGGRGAPKTVVRVPAPPVSFAEFHSFAQWAYGQGREPGGRVVAQTWRSPTDDDVDALGVDTTEPVLHVVRTRTLDGEVALLERSTYPRWLGELVVALPADCPSVTNALAEHGIRFTRADHTFTAVAATSEDAKLLGIPRGKPLLSHRRVSADRNGRPLEASDDRYLSGTLAISVASSEHANPLRWVDLD